MNLRIRSVDPDKLIRLGGAAPANQVFLALDDGIVSMPCGQQIPLASMIQYAVSMGHGIAIVDDRGGVYQYGPRFAIQCREVLEKNDRAKSIHGNLADVYLMISMIENLGAEPCPLASPSGHDRQVAIEALDRAAANLKYLAEDLRRVSNADSESDPNDYDEPGKDVFRILDERGREIERTEVLLPAGA